MDTQETMTAEKIRRRKVISVLGTCPDCGQPVKAGQEFLRTEKGVQHALCFYDPGHAQRMRAEAAENGKAAR